MIRSWEAIVDFYGELNGGDVTPSAQMRAIENVADYIAKGPLNSLLFGWTSMFDLCIQQTNMEPYSCPYLRIAPGHSGMLGFSYNDPRNMKPGKDWSRDVVPDQAIARLISFIDQLRWVTGPMSQYETSPSILPASHAG